ncbi:hypothetical protein ACWEQG_01595 [Microbispora sp. NPDC004025]
MTDADPFENDARRLAAAFTRRLRDAGAPTSDLLAGELVVMARGHGWRPVANLAPPPTPPAEGGETAAPRLPEEYLVRKAALDTRPPCTCHHLVGEHALVCGAREACTRCGCPTYTPAPSRSS